MTDNGKAYFYRTVPTDFLAQTASLTPSETGVYAKLLAIMHMYAEPIPYDAGRLARRVGADLRTFRPAMKALIDAGLITETDGFLWSPLIEREIEHFSRKSKIASENATIGRQKRTQNQRRNSADADKKLELDIEIDPQTPEGSEESYTSHSSVGVDAPARDGAGSHGYRVDDLIEIPKLGRGRVYKIVSLRPYVLIAAWRSKSGELHTFRMEFHDGGGGICRAIDRADADALPSFSGENDHGRTA
ncbi:MAG: hypothetical protein DI589_22960 [Shinella sp.]|nr:MAG: hypothetical protein DI589_22960 [Shinella sp.]